LHDIPQFEQARTNGLIEVGQRLPVYRRWSERSFGLRRPIPLGWDYDDTCIFPLVLPRWRRANSTAMEQTRMCRHNPLRRSPFVALPRRRASKLVNYVFTLRLTPSEHEAQERLRCDRPLSFVRLFSA
jgi:hypothetical protein